MIYLYSFGIFLNIILFFFNISNELYVESGYNLICFILCYMGYDISKQMEKK